MNTSQRMPETKPTTSSQEQTSISAKMLGNALPIHSAFTGYIDTDHALMVTPGVSTFVETVQPDITATTEWRSHELEKLNKWKNREYRQAYAEAAVEQGIAWQVRINRELRGLTQTQLAKMIGTQQSSVSRMEDPEYGSYSLPQLMKVAHSFDCALLVKFISYSTLARERKVLSADRQYVPGYDEETTGSKV